MAPKPATTYTHTTMSWCPLTTGTLRLEEPEGVREAQLQAGVSYARQKGVAHNVINNNAYEFRFVEIELK